MALHGPTHHEGTPSPQARVGMNQLLTHLDQEAELRLRPHLKTVNFQVQEILYRPEAHIRQIYFPATAVLCMLTVMADGRSIESATVGREGASWISASMGAPTMPCQTMVAIGGEGHLIDVHHVEDEIRQNGSFHQALTRYSHTLLIHALRTGSCNGLHSLRERCARWMLLTHDRVGSNEFPLTQEFLAQMLGVRRPSVTVVAGILQQAGFIRFRRGRITITDRRGLEGASCGCYAVLREVFDRLV